MFQWPLSCTAQCARLQVWVHLSSQEGAGAAVNPRKPQGYDQRQNLSFWGVAFSKCSQKLLSDFQEMLLQGHFDETTSRLDSWVAPLHSEPPNMGKGLIYHHNSSGDLIAGILCSGPSVVMGGRECTTESGGPPIALTQNAAAPMTTGSDATC